MRCSQKSQQFPGIAICRLDAPLYFANASGFLGTLKDVCSGGYHDAQQPIHTLIVDASSWNSLDMDGIAMLQKLAEYCKKNGKTLYFAAAKGAVRELMQLSTLVPKHIAMENISPTLAEAVVSAKKCYAAVMNASSTACPLSISPQRTSEREVVPYNDGHGEGHADCEGEGVEMAAQV